jgi:hypothetical protein
MAQELTDAELEAVSGGRTQPILQKQGPDRPGSGSPLSHVGLSDPSAGVSTPPPARPSGPGLFPVDPNPQTIPDYHYHRERFIHNV